MSDCPRKNKWFRPCKFVPRYDVVEPSQSLCATIARQWGTSEIDKELLLVHTTYVHDICVNCGKIVNPIENSK